MRQVQLVRNLVKVFYMMRFFILYLLVITGTESQDCNSRDFGNGGTVCVCNSNHCDTIAKPEKVERPQILVYTSNKAGLRFHKSSATFTESNPIDNQIEIDSTQEFQKIEGWGGAFTDATGINIKSLDESLQEKLLNSYFSEDGIEYSLCRVPIGGTDFSTRGYSYNDGSADEHLTRFQLAAEDFHYKIPLIKKAKNLTKDNLHLFASAWTAPKWMKTNNKYSGLGFLKDEMYQAWANYHIKFLDAYQEEGVEFWGLTTGNEPSLGLVPLGKINSVGWTGTLVTKWISNNLGPSLRKSNHKNIKLMILDDQRFFLPIFANVVLGVDKTKDYVDGIAVHWYYDGIFPGSLLTRTHENFPDKFILATEACHGDKPGQKHVALGSWERGEAYAHDIIEDMYHWVVGWVDWNMVLDQTGGPTYINNFVDSPIIVNATAGEFYKQPMYYNLGHFSKFVPRGSIRVQSLSFDTSNIPVVAFRRPNDDATVIVILNKEKTVVPITLTDKSRGSTQLDLSAKSITTLLYW